MAQLIAGASIDSFIDIHSPNTNYGPAGAIELGVLIAGGIKTQDRRAIVNFDVSSIPATASITQARMERTVSAVDSDGHSVRVTRCTRPPQWTENGVTWFSYDGVNNWTVQGGDLDAATPPAVSFAEAAQPGVHVVSGLGGFVRDALDLRNGIVSLLLHNTDEAAAETERSSWLAGAFWKLIVDYETARDLGRRSTGRSQGARGPRQPRAPVRAHAPAHAHKTGKPRRGGDR
jgi:hypothetical protein